MDLRKVLVYLEFIRTFKVKTEREKLVRDDNKNVTTLVGCKGNSLDEGG